MVGLTDDICMRWPLWHRPRPSAPRPVVNPRLLALETAKEIMAEVFGARPSDAEEMIRLRLEERSWSAQTCRLQTLATADILKSSS